MILNDKEIIELCEQGMIKPFLKDQVSKVNDRKVISYGVSSFGYDIRLNSEVKLFCDRSITLDPKDFDKTILKTLDVYTNEFGKYVILPPHSFALGSTIETLNIPNNITGLCTCKSSYARIGLNVNSTVFEAGFNGEITIELTNPTDNFMNVYVLEGVAQALFFKGEACLVSYADRNGKYQNQKGITTAR